MPLISISHDHTWLSGKVLGCLAIRVGSIPQGDSLLLFQKEPHSNVTQLFCNLVKKPTMTANGHTDSVDNN